MSIADSIELIASRMMEELAIDSLVIVVSMPDGDSTSWHLSSRGNAHANKTIAEMALEELTDAIYPTNENDDPDDYEECNS